ncbi:MAG: hypothetical protein HY764_02680 [Candidatus Portnoybacteria bacterium]|nr:hypothetical protein [Candidatus Portnoybacteria bacterium]
MSKTDFHGHITKYDDKDKKGYEYISKKIDPEEAKVLFSEAKRRGEAQFETQLGKNYSVTHKDGVYTVVKREDNK